LSKYYSYTIYKYL
jgi:hypothetical protein